MLFYRAALPLSRKTLNFVAGIIRRHRWPIGSLWRKLNPGQQALLVLAYLRKGETFAELAAGFGVGRTTAWRYVNETVELLAARAPKLRAAVRDANRAGSRLRHPRRHAHPDRPGRRRPALLLRQAQEARHEPAGHRQSRMGTSCGSPGRCPGRCTIRKPSGSGACWTNWSRRAWSPWPTRAIGQHLGEDPVPGEEQAGTAERSQPRPRETPRPRRARERAAQSMEDSPQAPLLPLARRETRKGHSRFAATRSLTRVESAQ